MEAAELTPKEREKLKEEIKQARAVGAIPVSSLVKIVGDYQFIQENYDL